MIKHITFKRDSNNFDDILKDQNIKKILIEKVRWTNHLMIGIDDPKDTNQSYITLKYGDDIITNITKDYSPIINVDYIPKRK